MKKSRLPADVVRYRKDKFVIFVYALVALMLCLQVGIIVWGYVL